MGYLSDLKRKAEALLQDLPDVIENSMVACEDGIADAIRDQMRHGWEGDGQGELQYLGASKDEIDYRQLSYARLKRQMYPEAQGRVNLHYTGAFAAKITANMVGDELIVESSDHKAPELEAKYGSDIYNLSDAYLTPIVEDEVEPAFQQEVRNRLDL